MNYTNESNYNNNTIIPKNKLNLVNLDNNGAELRENIFLSNTNTKPKNRHRTNSTSLIDNGQIVHH